MLSVIMLSVIFLSVIMLSVIILSVIMLNVIMLSVIRLNVGRLSVFRQNIVRLNVVRLNVVRLSVVAPFKVQLLRAEMFPFRSQISKVFLLHFLFPSFSLARQSDENGGAMTFSVKTLATMAFSIATVST